MKYISSFGVKLSLLLTSIAMFHAPLVSHAALIQLLQKQGTVGTGEVFSMPIRVNPQEGKQYTVRVALNFDPSLVEVRSFSFVPEWMPVSQPGYDSIDARKGQIVKTAGFPKGFSSPITFGTVTFLAKTAGNVQVSTLPSSFVLDAKNRNTLAGLETAAVNMQVSNIASVPDEGPDQVTMNGGIDSMTNQEFAIQSSRRNEENLFDIISTPIPPTPERPLWAFIAFGFAGLLLASSVSIIASSYWRWRKSTR
jgi:hypothetical protein